MDALILTGKQNRGPSDAAILTFSLVGSLGSQSHLVFALSPLLRSIYGIGRGYHLWLLRRLWLLVRTAWFTLRN